MRLGRWEARNPRKTIWPLLLLFPPSCLSVTFPLSSLGAVGRIYFQPLGNRRSEEVLWDFWWKLVYRAWLFFWEEVLILKAGQWQDGPCRDEEHKELSPEYCLFADRDWDVEVDCTSFFRVFTDSCNISCFVNEFISVSLADTDFVLWLQDHQ